MLLTDNAARLMSAISSLPELLERKKNIDKRTNMATTILDEIKVHIAVTISKFAICILQP